MTATETGRRAIGRAGAMGMFAGVPIAVMALIVASLVAYAEVPPVPVPAQNPITEPKRVLGKILFFDEQLSTSNTVACATCHVMSRAGTDNRIARNPGPDGLLNTPDDRLGSPGIIRSAISNSFVRDPVFGLSPQITDRAANSPINAAFAPQLFWDGRASGQFLDPETSAVVIPVGGALESQAVGPILNNVEMGHAGVTWTDVTTRLAQVRPLDLATGYPADVAAALAGGPGYPQLFQQAFGDPQITASRIAMAIATYQRTLISDQTPWDAYRAGNTGALTQGQIMGMQVFEQNCAVCHHTANGLFTDNTFRNIGLRPPGEDPGRQLVTGNINDRGRFKVPGLRNLSLRTTFMHNGQFTSLVDVVRFYVRAPGAAPQFPDNRDPAMLNINFPPQAEPALVDFLTNALRDPRVAGQQFPFDRVMLYSQRQMLHPAVIGGGAPGTGGVLPQVFASDPPMVGKTFRVGLDAALPGASASLAVSNAPPIDGKIVPQRFVGTVIAGSAGPGAGLATLHWPLHPGAVSGGETLYAQWIVQDPAGIGGQAFSPVLRIPVFCGAHGCPCYANCDGSTLAPVLNVADFTCFLQKFAAGDPYANCDQSTAAPALNVADFTCFLQKFAAGCP